VQFAQNLVTVFFTIVIPLLAQVPQLDQRSLNAKLRF
jgi:hypothetical protein